MTLKTMNQLFQNQKKRKTSLRFLSTFAVFLLTCLLTAGASGALAAESTEPANPLVVNRRSSESSLPEAGIEAGTYYIGSSISPYLFLGNTEIVLPKKETLSSRKSVIQPRSEAVPENETTVGAVPETAEPETVSEADIRKSLGLAVPGIITASIQLEYDADGYAVISLPENGAVLGIESAPADGVAVIQIPQSPAVPDDSKRWILEPAGDDAFLLRSAADPSYVITAALSEGSEPESIVLRKENGGDMQRFYFSSEEPRLERLASENTSFLTSGLDETMVLSIGNGIYNDTRNIYIYVLDNGDGQFFKVSYDDYGLAFIHHNSSNKVLTVRNGSAVSYQEVGQCEKDWSNTQRWIIEPSENGGFYIRSALNVNMVLDVVTGEVENSSPVQLYPFEGDSSQEWFFSDVPHMYLRDKEYMTYLANQYGSSTDYLIMVDNVSNHVGVYVRGAYGWENLYYWYCVTGKYSTPTVRGEYTVFNKKYSFDGNMDSPEWYTCYYATEWYPSYFFHSIIYYQGTWDVLDASMGYNASHGCVRLNTDNALWIYENIPYGTKVVSY